jgi:hypothetical protein
MLSASVTSSVVTPAIGQQPSATGAIEEPESPSGRVAGIDGVMAAF